MEAVQVQRCQVGRLHSEQGLSQGVRDHVSLHARGEAVATLEDVHDRQHQAVQSDFQVQQVPHAVIDR